MIYGNEENTGPSFNLQHMITLQYNDITHDMITSWIVGRNRTPSVCSA